MATRKASTPTPEVNKGGRPRRHALTADGRETARRTTIIMPNRLTGALDVAGGRVLAERGIVLERSAIIRACLGAFVESGMDLLKVVRPGLTPDEAEAAIQAAILAKLSR